MARRGPISRNDANPRPEPAKQPELPADREWLPETVEWWRALGRSAEAQRFAELDWLHLKLCARLFDDFVREPSRQLLDSIRLYLSKFGLSPEDRARLHLPQPEKPPVEASGDRPRRSRDRPDPRLSAS